MRTSKSLIGMGLIAGLAGLLNGCAMTPDEIHNATTEKLCRAYSAPLSDTYFSPEIRDELYRRGAGWCTDPNVVMSRANNSLALIQSGTALMQQSAPRPAPVIVSPPITCHSYGGWTTCQ